MEINRMLDVTEDVIINLLLHLEPDGVINFFEAYPEFDYLLKDKHFLHELSVYNEISNISNLKDSMNHVNVSVNERLKIDARNGDLDGAIRMLELGVKNYNSAMINAIRKRHINIAKLMLKYEANDYNETMRQASLYENIQIVKLMLELNANNYKETAYCGNIDIVKLLLKYIELNISTYNEIMETVTNDDRLDVIELILLLGANDFDTAISAVFYGGI